MLVLMGLFSLPVGRITADVFTTPHTDPELDPAPAVIGTLTKTRNDLRFAVYSFTHPGIADAVIAAYQRGVVVRGVVDASQAHGGTSQVARLVAAGIDLRLWGDGWHLMHDKAWVSDIASARTTVGLGSYNWTTQAEKSNVEVLLISRGLQVSRKLGPALHAQIEWAYGKGHSL
jgi:phosphatidylserine/phosphatidylglycerophosphate/cardiolipin synthase-like enzyme